MPLEDLGTSILELALNGGEKKINEAKDIVDLS